MQYIIAQKVPEVDFTQNILTLNFGAPDVNGCMPWQNSTVKAVES